MLCDITNSYAFKIFSFCVAVLPLTNAGGTKKVNPWTGENIDADIFITPKPFPWNRITVPKLLQLNSDEKHSDYEPFYTFLYILIALGILILIYYCCKCCSYVKVYTNVMISPSHDHRRHLANRPRSTRCYTTNRSHLGRTFSSEQRYERMTPEVHNASRIRRANMHNNCYNQEVCTEGESYDKPPDYTSVVCEDFEKSPETPPPSYDENILNETNGMLTSHGRPYITDTVQPRLSAELGGKGTADNPKKN